MIDALIYDWNLGPTRPVASRRLVQVDDETLRDGLQSPSVRTPTIDQMIELLHLMAALGMESVNIGLPGAGPHVAATATRLAPGDPRPRLPDPAQLRGPHASSGHRADRRDLAATSACRSRRPRSSGRAPSARRSRAGRRPPARTTEEALDFARRSTASPIMYVTEDTTRAHPETVRRLYGQALDMGAQRLVVVRHRAATPRRTAPARWCASSARCRASTARTVEIDWHGHQDRGLA